MSADDRAARARAAAVGPKRSSTMADPGRGRAALAAVRLAWAELQADVEVDEPLDAAVRGGQRSGARSDRRAAAGARRRTGARAGRWPASRPIAWPSSARSRRCRAPTRMDRIAELKVRWDALPPMPSEYAASLTRRFQDACRAFEDRERRRMLAEAAAGRLETLATELEQLRGVEQPLEEIVARWRGLRRDADVLREHASANPEPPSGSSAPLPRSRRRSSEHQQARAQAGAGQPAAAAADLPPGRDAGRGEQITLKAGDRALRDIRAALDERAPLPSKKDRQEIQARLEAARAELGAARAGAARRRRVAALGEPAGAGRAVRARWRRSRPKQNLEVAGRRMRELQARWKQVALAPRAQGEAMWRRFKTAQDEVFARTSAHFAAQNEERVGEPRPQAGALRARRGAGRFHRLGQDRHRDPGAAGRVEDDRSGHARTREGHLGAVPRRLRSVLHPAPGRSEAPEGRLGRQPRAQGSALRAGRGAGRLHRLGQRPRRSSNSCRPSGRRSVRCASRSRRRCGSASAPRAIASSIATSIATSSSCRRRPRRATASSASSRRCCRPTAADAGPAPDGLYAAVQQARARGSRRRSCRARSSRTWPRDITRRVAQLVGSWPAAFAGTDLDPEATRKRMEKLLARGRGARAGAAAAQAAARPVAGRAARAAVARAAGRQHDGRRRTQRRERRIRAGAPPSRKCGARRRSGRALDRCRRMSPVR